MCQQENRQISRSRGSFTYLGCEVGREDGALGLEEGCREGWLVGMLGFEVGWGKITAR